MFYHGLSLNHMLFSNAFKQTVKKIVKLKRVTKLKGLVHPKMKIMSLMTHHFVPSLSYCQSSEHSLKG